MNIVGCDFHSGWQQVAVFDAATGEIEELKLMNGDGEAERFYRQLSVRLYWMLRTNTAYPEIARIESSPR